MHLIRGLVIYPRWQSHVRIIHTHIYNLSICVYTYIRIETTHAHKRAYTHTHIFVFMVLRNMHVRLCRRLIAFGSYAGKAGMINTFRGLGERLLALGYSSPFLNVSSSYMYPDFKVCMYVSARTYMCAYTCTRT